ncbi:zinc finger protein 26 isoform X2 [Folsomia candida]|uniref:Zinc finger protein 84 n=1 Tax=Folsomia candida TaxID=158441 RepID=A0A226ERQ1_FOLCA|nr:zinc finger protein 26 isoform X2 [Folsomia candida]OXA59888.1 Zinc finger protein 84 [Folsomia candida]
MAISSATKQSIQTKVDDIETFIKHLDKDSSLRRNLNKQFLDIVQEQKNLCKTPFTIANAASVRKQVEEFQTGLETFRRWVVKQIAKNKVIQSGKINHSRLTDVELQMNVGLDIDEKENEESDYDEKDFSDLFIPLGKTGSALNLPEKRIRKQVVHPDFVTTQKKPKVEPTVDMEEDEEINDNESASFTESESNSPSKFNGSTNNNGLPEFPCPVCKKIFRKKGHMTRHLLTHEPEKPFACEIGNCTKRFAAKYSLQMHLLNRHNTDAKPHDCTICDRRFTLKKELDQHVQSHKDGFKPKFHQCANCDLKFITQGDLDSHLEMTHPEESFICSFSSCEKTFPRKYNLIRHERTHSTEKLYHCDVCDKEFGTKNGLQMHLQAHELEDKNKNLSCHLCDKKFAVQQNLEIHIAFHNQSNDKPYSCELCEVRFKSEERLQRHCDTHGSTEGRIYHCSYCDKHFPRKYNLIRHELSHTHGRRKPKDGLPIPIPRVLEERERLKEQLHNGNRGAGSCNNKNNGAVSTDDESCNNGVNNLYSSGAEEYSTISSHDYQSPQEPSRSGYNFVYQTVSKSELYATLFGHQEENSSDGISHTSAKQKYHVLKFENY